MQILEQNKKLLKEKMDLEIKMKMLKSAKSQASSLTNTQQNLQNQVANQV